MFSKLFKNGKEAAIKRFHELYYYTHERTWTNTRWLGTSIEKCPLDMWIYQEILHAVQPDVIIETGTYKGGGALFMASICDLLNKGRVVTIDIEHHDNLPQHKRITYLTGSSVDPKITEQVKNTVSQAQTAMVVLDSNHHKDHVLAELKLYHPFVTKGSYLIVEDTNINGHPVSPKYGPGPMEAVDQFLAENKDFQIDDSKEKYYLTFNPRGYLKKAF